MDRYKCTGCWKTPSLQYNLNARSYIELIYCFVTGSLELFDATSLSTRPYPLGVRKVVLSHSCSNIYLTADKYGQARGCLVTTGKIPVSTLNRNTHCVDGRKLHVCTDMPHVYLDSFSNIYSPNSTQSSPLIKKACKIRFEKPSTKTRHKKVLYAVVTRGTWELKLRAQNGIIKRAVTASCFQLWQKSIHLLFQRVVEQQQAHHRERNSNLAKVCDIDPALIKAEILQSTNADDFALVIHQAWRHHAVLNLLGTSMPWSRMSERYKDLITVVVYRTVRKRLIDSLLEVANRECISDSRWGKMQLRDRLILLERTLTLAWLSQRVGSRQFILHIIEKYLDSRTTTFIINENGWHVSATEYSLFDNEHFKPCAPQFLWPFPKPNTPFQ